MGLDNPYQHPPSRFRSAKARSPLAAARAVSACGTRGAWERMGRQRRGILPWYALSLLDSSSRYAMGPSEARNSYIDDRVGPDEHKCPSTGRFRIRP